ncbi:AlpA family phage regulatory protein [Burkholderia gladioli]|uniref:helix-turn-helix transcriptional regulator n=1 Tax=Burkholderia gladioli TaxID=28095 RepID=UPI0016409020|nr:helix-turn-helix domain-containing protein [Burkholderia gladioli]MDC6132405.1 AlpA family phage regulatory protein [Burkholderia gladioli]
MEDNQTGVKRPKDAAKHLGISIPTLWRWLRVDSDFPRPFKLADRVTLFYTAELDAYLERKAQGSRA